MDKKDKNIFTSSPPDVSLLANDMPNSPDLSFNENTPDVSMLNTNTPNVSDLFNSAPDVSMLNTNAPDIQTESNFTQPEYNIPRTKQITFPDGSRQVFDKDVDIGEELKNFYKKIPTKNYKSFIDDSIAQEEKKIKDLTTQLNKHLERKNIIETVKDKWKKIKLLAKIHSAKAKKEHLQKIDTVFSDSNFYDFLKNLDKLPTDNTERLNIYENMREKLKNSIENNKFKPQLNEIIKPENYYNTLPEFNILDKLDFDSDLEKRYIRELYKNGREKDIKSIIDKGGIILPYEKKHPSLDIDTMDFNIPVKNRTNVIRDYYKRKLGMSKFSSWFDNFFEGVASNAFIHRPHYERIYDEYLRYTGKAKKMASEQYSPIAYMTGNILGLIASTMLLNKGGQKLMGTGNAFEGIKLQSKDTKNIMQSIKNFKKLKNIKKGTQEYKVLKDIINNIKLSESLGQTAEGYNEVKKLKSILDKGGTVYDILNSNTKIKRGIDSIAALKSANFNKQNILEKVFNSFFDNTKYKIWSKAPDSVIKNLPQITSRLISNGVGWAVLQKLKTDKSSWDYRLNKTKDTFGKDVVNNFLQEIPLTLRGNLNFVVGSALITALTHINELKRGETQNFVSDYFRWWIWNYLLMATSGVHKFSSSTLEKNFKKKTLDFVKKNFPKDLVDTDEKAKQSAFELLSSLYNLRDYDIKNFDEFHFPSFASIDDMLKTTLGKQIKDRTKMFLRDPAIAKKGEAYAYNLAVKDIRRDLQELFNYKLDKDGGKKFFDDMNRIRAQKQKDEIKNILNEDIPLEVIEDILRVAHKKRTPQTLKINNKEIKFTEVLDEQNKRLYYYWTPKKALDLDNKYPYKREVWIRNPEYRTIDRRLKERVRLYYATKEDFINKTPSDKAVVGIVGTYSPKKENILQNIAADIMKKQKELTTKYDKYFIEDEIKSILKKNNIDTENKDINILLKDILNNEEQLQKYINQDTLDMPDINKISFDETQTKDFIYFNLKSQQQRLQLKKILNKFFKEFKITPKYYKMSDGNVIVSYPKKAIDIKDLFYTLRNYKTKIAHKENTEKLDMNELVNWIMPVTDLYSFLNSTHDEMKTLIKKLQLFKGKLLSGKVGKTLQDKIKRGSFNKWQMYNNLLILQKIIKEGYITQNEADGIIKILASSYVPKDISSLYKGMFKNRKQVKKLNNILNALFIRGVNFTEGKLIHQQVKAEKKAFESAAKFLKYLKDEGVDYNKKSIGEIVDIAKTTEEYKNLEQSILEFTKSSVVGNDLAYKLADGIDERWEGWLPALVKKLFKNKFIRNRLGDKKFRALLRLSDRFRNYLVKDYYDSANPFFAAIGNSREFEGKKASFLVNSIMRTLMPELFDKKTRDIYDNVLLFDKTKEEIKKWFIDSGLENVEANERYRTMLRLKSSINLMNELLIDFSRDVLPKESALIIPRFRNLNLLESARYFSEMLNSYSQSFAKDFMDFQNNTLKNKLEAIIQALEKDKTLKLDQSYTIKISDFYSLFKDGVEVPHTKNGITTQIPIKKAAKDIVTIQKEIQNLELKRTSLEQDTFAIEKNPRKIKIQIDEIEKKITDLTEELNGYDNSLIGNINILRKNAEAINKFILNPDEYMRHLIKKESEAPNIIANEGKERISSVPNKIIQEQYLTMDEILENNLELETRLTKTIPLTWQYYFDKLSNYYLFNNFKKTEFLIDSSQLLNLEVQNNKAVKKKKLLDRILHPIKSVEKNFNEKEKILYKAQIEKEIKDVFGENSEAIKLYRALQSPEKSIKRMALKSLKKAYNDAILLTDLTQKDLDKYIKIEDELRGENFFNIRDNKNYYIHKDLLYLLKQMNSAANPTNPILKTIKLLTNKLKIRQFYIPTRIGWNDSFQSLIGGINPLESIDEALRIMTEGYKNDLYRELHHTDLFNISSAFDNTLDTKFLKDFTSQIKKKNIQKEFPELVRMFNETYTKHPELFKDTIGTKGKIGKFIDMLFLNKPIESMQTLAWQLDEVMRISYVLTYMKHNPSKTLSEAVYNANLYLINYDRLPKKTKTLANYFFFTPVFKTQTWRLWKEMITKGLIGGDIDLLKSFGRTILMRLITDFTMNFIFNLQKQGPKQTAITLDNRILNPLGYRYMMTPEDITLPKKVYSISSPAVEPDKLIAQNYRYLLNSLSPAIQIIVSIMTGRKRFGGKFRSPDDSTLAKIGKTILYSFSYSYPMVTSLLDNFFNPDNGLTDTEKLLNFLSLVYVYKTKDDYETALQSYERARERGDLEKMKKLKSLLSRIKSHYRTMIRVNNVKDTKLKRELINKALKGNVPYRKELIQPSH